MKGLHLFLFLLILTSTGYSQTVPITEDPRDRMLLDASVVLITVGGSHASEPKQGTGFLLRWRGDEGTKDEGEKSCRQRNDPNDDKTVVCKILLVTNKHVLPAEGDDSPVYITINNFSPTSKQVSNVQIEVVDEVGKYLPSVKVHPHGYDLAMVDVTRDLEKGNVTNFKTFATSSLAVNSNPPKDMRALPAALGDTVYVLGYPSGIYDPRNAYPILRSGIIATNPHGTFEFNQQLREKFGLTSVKGFLIDAAIFPGSSGSLVLRKPINHEYANSPYALGIISASIPIEDVELKSTQRMGLAVVISSDAIFETLKLFN